MSDINNRQVIAEYYESHYTFLASIIKSVIFSDNPEDVVECLEDVFVIALKKKNLYKHNNIGGWFVKTAKYVTYNFNKKYLRARKNTMQLSEYAFVAATAVHHDSTDVFEDFVYEYYVNENNIELLMHSLSKSEADFYQYKYVDNMEYDEISRLMGKSTAALHTMNNRVKNKLRKSIYESKIT